MKIFKVLIISVLLSGIVFILGFSYAEARTPNELYKVYLNDEVIGFIKSKEELEEYINNEQITIREKYGVDKVYIPNGLEIVKVLTYKNDILTAEEIYEKIKEKEPFTIKGYIINIIADEKHEQLIEDYSETTDVGELLETIGSQTLYVLNKEVFEESIDRMIKTFVGSATYNNYINETQNKIKEYGSIIENVDIGEKITIQEGKISANKTIYTTKEDLTKYLLYGTLEEQGKYTVKSGDDVASVAYNNTLSVDEFLVANPDISSKNALLYTGQIVNTGLIKPQISIVTETHSISEEEQKYRTTTRYDSTIIQGYSYVSQNGQNGTNKVTQKVQYVNGKIANIIPVETAILKPTVDKIIVKGSKTVPSVGDLNNWGWAASCYTITSYYGPRWGRMHNGIDIAGCGYGSPIYSINNGRVEETGYDRTMGNFVIINHYNGYYSVYMHLATITTQEGYTVSRGTKVGTMGSTGRSTGTHLHLGIYTSCKWCFNKNALNPMSFYN